MAGGQGGKRAGAGRKPQSQNVKKVDPKIINAGILPLEMRLIVSRHMWAEAVDHAGNIIDLDKAKAAADFAEAALGYTSAKLQAIVHSGPDGGPIEHKHEVLAEVRALMAAESKGR